MAPDRSVPALSSWRRMLPPRGVQGCRANWLRVLVSVEVCFLTEDEREIVADTIETVERGGRVADVPEPLVTKALTIAAQRRRHPEAWGLPKRETPDGI
jgi:hypothetical protein